MSKVTVIVTPDDGGRDGWAVHHFRWVGPGGPRPDIKKVRFVPQNGKFVGTFDLEDGTINCLAVHVTLGAEVEIDIDPQWRIVQPAGEKWPVIVSVHATRTQRLKTLYFREGAPQ